MTLQREAYQRRRAEQLDQRSQGQLDSRQFNEAVASALQWFALDPYNETAAGRLMQAHFMAGRRTAALEVYTALERTLAQDLGVAPSSEIARLAESIRAAPPATPQASRTQLSTVPFVGRADEHEQLAAAYRNVRHGSTQGVCVEGEAGIGKTRLVEVFFDWVALQAPVDVLRGRAFEVGGRLPYQPLVDALRVRLDAENAPDDLLADVWLAELSQLLPELRDRYPDLPQPLRGNADFTRSRLFEAVAALGQALAARKPVILFIDDIQWADAGTLDLLQYLARRWAENGEPILLVWAVRAENMATSLSLRDWLTHMGRSMPLSRVRLSPLEDADIRQLVDSLADEGERGNQVAHAFSEWLQVETAGLPFFVVEMLKMLEEQGILVGGDIDEALGRVRQAEQLPLPQGVRELILARVGRLFEDAAALLLASAVIGREASFERLAATANLDEQAGLTALEALIDSLLFVETQIELRPYRIAHDNIRDVVYTEAGEARRRVFHRRAFAGLKLSGAAAEVAFHAHAARMPAPALTYSQAAGDEAMKKYAFAEAVIHYERALALLPQVELPSAQRQALYIHYGRALELNGAYAAALAHYHKMEALAETLDDRPLKLAALVAQSTIYVTANVQNDMARGEIVCEQALSLAQELGDEATEAKIQWNLLNVYRMTQRNELALAAGERSLLLAEKLGLREQLAYTTNDLGYVYQASASTEEMNRVLETAISLWRELGNLPMLTDSLTSYANNMVFAGQLDRALEMSQEARATSRSLNNPWSESFTLFTPCFVHWYRMEAPQALDAMRRCIALAREVGFVGGEVTMSNYQAQLLLALGQVDEASAVMQGIRETAERNIPLFLSGAAGADALVAMHQGDLDGAAKILLPFTADDPLYDLMNCFTLENSLCEYLRRQGAWNKLKHFTGKLVGFLRDRQLVIFLPQFLYLHAVALNDLGASDSAWDALHEALTICEETGTRWQKWQILALQADIADARNQDEIAVQLRRQWLDARDWLAEQAKLSGLPFPRGEKPALN